MLKSIQNANRTTLAVVGIVLAIILFLAVNVVSSLTLRSARADLTEDKLFTVTAATENVLAGIRSPITLHLYQSAALMDMAPNLRVYADRVNELLRTYEQRSDGLITVERINPLPFSAEEDRALSYGLSGANLERTGERGYFGLVGTNTVDQLESIQFFDPGRERFLEYDLTRMVYRLTETAEPKIAVIDGLDMFGDTQRGRYPLAITEMLSENYALTPLEQNITAIPGDTDALVVVHPAMLTDSAKYAIDQFVLSGRPALVFIDPLAENSARSQTNANVPQFPSTNLKPLTDAWGVEMVDGKVVGDRDMAIRVTSQAGGQRIIADYPPWLQIRSQAFDANDVITSQLTLMRMSSAGSLKPLPGATTTFTPLIRSSLNSMLYDEKVVEQRPAPTELLDVFVPSNEAQVLAARVTGVVKTAFPDGPPPREPVAGEENAPPPIPGPQITESAGPINVIIVADVDMLVNSHMVNDQGAPISNNNDFVINALDNLTGGEELIGLRGRGISFRPFTTIENIESEAEANYQATESRLTEELEATQRQLAELQRPGQTAIDVASLTQEQREAVARFNGQLLDLRQQLRDVRAALRQEIDALDTRLRLYNILLIPGIIVLIGILAAIWRRVRLSRYLASRRTA